MFLPDLENVKKTLKRTLFPADVIIEVTSYCNLKCIMCPQKSLKRRKGKMNFEIYKKIINEVSRENSTTRIWLAIMGEPLLIGNKLVVMVEYAKKSGIKSVNLNTNGILLTNELSDKLIDVRLDYILFGVDAFTKSTYNKIRPGGNFEILLSNIDYLIRAKNLKQSDSPKLILQFIIMDENENEVEEFKKFWLDKGQIVKIRPKLGWGTGVEANKLQLTDSERNFPCPWLIRTVSIHWNGRLAQCDADYEGNHSPGNILTSSIKDIWQGELSKRREKHWSLDFSHELCSKCKDWQAGRSQFFYPENS